MAKYIKCILIGPKCGKTSLIERYVDDVFCQQEHTQGVDYRIKNVASIKNTIVNDQGQLLRNNIETLCIWDTGDFTKYMNIILSYYRMCSYTIFCFPLHDKSSFDLLLQIIDKIKNMKNLFDPDSHSILVGTQDDLLNDEDRVEFMEYYNTKFNEISEKYNIEKFFQVSSKTGLGVNESFEYILNRPYNYVVYQTDNKLPENNNYLSFLSNYFNCFNCQ